MILHTSTFLTLLLVRSAKSREAFNHIPKQNTWHNTRIPDNTHVHKERSMERKKKVPNGYKNLWNATTIFLCSIAFLFSKKTKEFVRILENFMRIKDKFPSWFLPDLSKNPAELWINLQPSPPYCLFFPTRTCMFLKTDSIFSHSHMKLPIYSREF